MIGYLKRVQFVHQTNNHLVFLFFCYFHACNKILKKFLLENKTVMSQNFKLKCGRVGMLL